MLRYADILGSALEYQREKRREDSGVLRRGSRGQRSDPRHGCYGKFAGILQGDIRQWVSSGRMLMIVVGEEAMRSRLLRDPWHNQSAKQYRRLPLAPRSELRVASCGITKRLLGW